MKRIISIFLFTCCAILANAQVYNYKKVCDKFDDIVSQNQQKTLIQWTEIDSIPAPILSIEEKGKKPIYFVCFVDSEHKLGDKDDLTTFASVVFGFQTSWMVIELNAFKKWKNTESEEEKEKLIKNFCYEVVHRVISSTWSSFNYETEVFWIEHVFGNENRIIYTME